MTASSTDTRPPRPARAQAVLSVRSRRELCPHTVRVVAGGPGLAEFHDNEFTDKYAKLVFVDPALGLTPPYDLAALRETLPPEQRPVTRTYTVRHVDHDRSELSIDFVVHGPVGLAAPWAAQSEPGDTLVLSGAGGGYRPDPDVDWHLFAGDESALPAICSAFEVLPADARGVAYLESHDGIEYLDATPPAGIEVHWLQRDRDVSLADAIADGPWPPGRVGVFAHGEREQMKAVRAVLKSRLTDADQLSLSGYWARGRTEDVFQAEKRQPIGRID